jgi:hypothetical protein
MTILKGLAIGAFEQALGALPYLPETRAIREQAIDLRLALRSALYPLGDFTRLLAYLHEAASLAETLDDPRRLGQICIFLSHYISSPMPSWSATPISAGNYALRTAQVLSGISIP